MEGENGVGLVGIRVGPGMGHRGVIDGEHLDEPLAGLGSPVDKHLDVVKFTYAEVFLRPEGEHRYGHTGSAPRGLGVDKPYAGHCHALTLCGGFDNHPAIVATLPAYDIAAILLEDKELVFNLFGELVEGKRAAPCGEECVAHHDSFGGIPVAHGVASARNSQHLVGGHHRSVAAQQHRGGLNLGRHRAAFATAHAIGEHHRVERLVPGLVLPSVEDFIGLDPFA